MTAFRLVERAWAATTTIDVDEDGFVLSIQVVGDAAPGRSGSESFAVALGASLGVRQHDRILTVGDLVLAVGQADRLVSLEWRLGPAVLRPGFVAVPNGQAAALQADVAWDENRRADLPGRSLGTFDWASRRLAIQLGPEPAAWGFLAEGFAVGLSGTGALAAVFVAGCPIDLCALVGTG